MSMISYNLLKNHMLFGTISSYKFRLSFEVYCNDINYHIGRKILTTSIFSIFCVLPFCQNDAYDTSIFSV